VAHVSTGNLRDEDQDDDCMDEDGGTDLDDDFIPGYYVLDIGIEALECPKI
jgi:hypothetical protein